VVAAIHGTALGGGFETAISCHYRCAVPSAKIGFPEVKLGLLPGAGGTQRSPRLAGVEAALELMTTGTPVSAARAKELGLIDEIVDGDLREAALNYARKLIDSGAPVRRTSEIDAPVYGDFEALRATVARRARGQVAPLAIVDCVEAATKMSFTDGMKTEREKFSELMRGEQSAALRHFFFAERQAAKIEGLAKDTPVRGINTVGIIGGGTMGGGIAMSFANAGIPVTLVEISDEAIERGLSIIERNYAGSVKRGKLSEEKAAQCKALIEGSTNYAALADVDLVIEAVFEDPGLKKKIFAQRPEPSRGCHWDSLLQPGAYHETARSRTRRKNCGRCIGNLHAAGETHSQGSRGVGRLLRLHWQPHVAAVRVAVTVAPARGGDTGTG
jgi:3-hydroxyacyl-CoA dehydrogenase